MDALERIQPTDAETLHAEATAVLRALVGRGDADLRSDQWEAIRALVVDRRRALVVQRTGWGKSAVYFVATALLRARGAGPTVIVSPLLSLMRNQVDAARRAGIHAETINSANPTEWDDVAARVAVGEVDVLLVSPERLNNPGFRDEVLPRLAATTGLLVVDEAHCISDWGHDFRPDYRRIRTLLEDLPGGTPVLATTATANARVTADVAEQLARTGEPGPEHPHADVLVLRGPLDRPSLHLSVRRLPDHASQLAWLTVNLPRLAGSGIVYCLTVAAADQTAAHLRTAGLDVRAYTGQTEPAERLECEADLLANRVKALVATSALGMGYDKPDLGFVVHLGAPQSPIAYYQQVGRAGRATTRADVVLLPGRDDRAIWDWFAAQAFPDERSVRQALDALAEHGGPLSTAALETRVDLRRSRLEMMLSVLDVDGAVSRVRGGWVSTGRPWAYDSDRYARVAATRREEQQAIVEYVTGDRCRMAFLRSALDDPELAADPGWTCGRCDACGSGYADVVPEPDEVAQAAARQDEPGVELVPRRLWPTGMAALGVPLSGRITEDDRAEPGRAVARLDGLGLGGVLRQLFSEAAPDGDLSPALRGPVLRVLDAWAPAVDGVVVVRSTRRPHLVGHLAAGVARHLGVPVVGAVTPSPGSAAGRHDVNSAQRLAAVHHRLVLDLGPDPGADLGADLGADRSRGPGPGLGLGLGADGAARLAGLEGRRVLLVDDRVDSGWTLTVAARLVRRAGAAAVLPFVLGVG